MSRTIADIAARRDARALTLRAAVGSIVVASIALTTAAAGVPIGRAEDVGLSTERLKRIDALVQRYIGANEISGAVTLVARKGRAVHFEAHGLMDIESRTPMRKDAIFRIASMTKPITAVAVLMLVEEGKIRLTDPVARFIPEFKSMKVAVPRGGESAAAPGLDPSAPIDLVPANREITIRDLITHTAGLVSGGAGARLAPKIAPRQPNDTLADYIPRLAKVPLDFQPGTEWRYSGLAGLDTLGRVVEIASGLTFDQFLRQRIFEPLGMKDTTFYPADDRSPRIATLYRSTPQGLTRDDNPNRLSSRTYFSGGAGLWSTAEDYLQFAQMLVNGGELGGTRLLSPRTVDLMGSNHVGELHAKSSLGRKGMGFGLAVEIVLDPVEAEQRRSKGSFGWYGVYGPHFWVDRREQLTGIILIQRSVIRALSRDFESAVMQAIID